MRFHKAKTTAVGDVGQTSRQAGFTLIETSVAMVIMMVAALGVASLFTYSISYNSGGQDRAIAVTVAQQQIEQLRSVPFTDPLLNVSGPTVLSPNIVSNGRTYQVTKTVTGSNNNASGTPTLKTITIRVDPRSTGWAGFPVIIRTMRSSNSTGAN